MCARCSFTALHCTIDNIRHSRFFNPEKITYFLPRSAILAHLQCCPSSRIMIKLVQFIVRIFHNIYYRTYIYEGREVYIRAYGFACYEPTYQNSADNSQQLITTLCAIRPRHALSHHAHDSAVSASVNMVIASSICDSFIMSGGTTRKTESPAGASSKPASRKRLLSA